MPLTYTNLPILISYGQTYFFLLTRLAKSCSGRVARPLWSGKLAEECEDIPENLSVFGEFAKVEA